MIGVRAATADDLESILAIYNQSITTTTSVFSYEPHTLAMRRVWLIEKQTDGFPVLVAFEGVEIAGFATYGPFRAWPAYKYTVENSVHVAEAFRRRGVARALMTALVADARQRDYHAIVAGIVSDNDASLALHTSLGFTEVAHFREVGYKFGQWRDLKFMELLLETPRHPKEGDIR
jgi:phosphinothricin acetyltransferase